MLPPQPHGLPCRRRPHPGRGCRPPWAHSPQAPEAGPAAAAFLPNPGSCRFGGSPARLRNADRRPQTWRSSRRKARRTRRRIGYNPCFRRPWERPCNFSCFRYSPAGFLPPPTGLHRCRPCCRPAGWLPRSPRLPDRRWGRNSSPCCVRARSAGKQARSYSRPCRGYAARFLPGGKSAARHSRRHCAHGPLPPPHRIDTPSPVRCRHRCGCADPILPVRRPAPFPSRDCRRRCGCVRFLRYSRKSARPAAGSIPRYAHGPPGRRR